MAGRGPLPNPNARRRNAATVPGFVLPAEGRKGRIPKCPYELGAAGRRWWKWAWRLPQATKWDDGSLYAIARRASLEDDLAAVEDFEGIDFDELLRTGAPDALRELEFIVRKLCSLATGRTSIMREMRELDNRFGLTAKGLADLRWMIATPQQTAPAAADGQGSNVRRIRATEAG